MVIGTYISNRVVGSVSNYHLNNVLAVINDRKIASGSSGTVFSNDFTSDVSGLIALPNATLTHAGGELEVSVTSQGAGAQLSYTGTTPGKVYRLYFTADLNSQGSIAAQTYDVPTSTVTSEKVAGSDGVYYLDFLASSSQTTISIVSTVAGSRTFYLDDMVLELRPSVFARSLTSSYAGLQTYGAGVTASIVGHRLEVDNLSLWNGVQCVFPTEVGETYTVHYTLDLDGGPQLTPFVRNNITSANIQVQHIYSDGRYTLTFVAPSTETLFAVENPNSGTRKMYLSYLFVQDNNASVVDDFHYDPVLLSWSDYYAFGMTMPGRNGGVGYRYQFNGMEHDSEVSGNGNSYTTEFRQYDPRLGRWKSLDPLMSKFPHISPYVGFANNPVYYTDPYGLEPVNDGNDGDRPGGLPEQSENGKIYTGDNGVEYIGTDDGGYSILGKDVSYVHNDTGGTNVAGSNDNIENNDNVENNDNPLLPPSKNMVMIPVMNRKVERLDLNITSSGEFNDFLEERTSFKPNSTFVVVEGEIEDPYANVSTILTVGGVAYSILEFTTYSKEFNSWLGKNGKMYTGLEGKGPNQHTGNRGGAKNASNNYKNAGRVVFWVATAWSVSNVIDGVVNNDTDKVVDNAGDIVIGTIMYKGGVYGFAVGGTALLVNWGLKKGYLSPHVDHMKGKSLEQQNRGNTCFSPETKVWKSNGTFVSISEIEPGDTLYTYNTISDSLELGVVSKKVSYLVESICIVKIGSETIKVTEEHPFYSNSTWKKIIEIQKGELLKTDKDFIELTDIKTETTSDSQIVVNIEVNGQHNYFVTKSKILVHNKSIK
ncbi:hypothetical protein GCM10009118_15910 [Wandonia haliotis]|uniref:Hint domain-containing protein n=1 Tax=Wandonia haliotis TaxID=574963 RepID=A0ABP3Y347_9FLAO